MKGVTLTQLKHISTPKGDIFHALKSSDSEYCGFGEAYFSEVHSGTKKGWKRHNRFTLNLVVIVGEIQFTIYDDREGSDTFGEFQVVKLSPQNNYQRLTVEPGLWLAFEGIHPHTSMLMNIIPEPHDPQEADSIDLSEINYNSLQ